MKVQSVKIRRRLVRLREILARVRTEKEGIAAVEFAMILPLMVMMYLGCAELTQGIMASRKMAIVSRTLSDIVAQQTASTDMTDATLNSIWGAASAIMSPFDVSTLKMTVSAVEFVTFTSSPGASDQAYIYPPYNSASPPTTASPAYEAKVRWSKTPTATSYTGTSGGGTARTCARLTPVSNSVKPTATTLPNGLYTAGSLVVADVSYQYTPTFGGSLLAWSSTSDLMNMSNTSYMRPRNTTGNCNASNESWICYSGASASTCSTY